MAWWLDACAVGPKAFALRSLVNGIVGTCADRQIAPQVPRIPMSTFPRRPTAHAQTMKSSPRPLTSPEVHEKTHCIEVKINFFLINKSRIEPGDKRDVCDVQVTSRPFFYINTHNEDRVFASWRKRSWVMDEAIECSGWNLILTMSWLNGIWTWKRCLKRIRRGWLDPRSKLNEKQSTIATHEAVVYCPMIDWKTKKNRT